MFGRFGSLEMTDFPPKRISFNEAERSYIDKGWNKEVKMEPSSFSRV